MTTEEAKTCIRDRCLIQMGEDTANSIITALSITYTLTAEEVANGISRQRLHDIWLDEQLGL